MNDEIRALLKEADGMANRHYEENGCEECRMLSEKLEAALKNPYPPVKDELRVLSEALDRWQKSYDEEIGGNPTVQPEMFPMLRRAASLSSPLALAHPPQSEPQGLPDPKTWMTENVGPVPQDDEEARDKWHTQLGILIHYRSDATPAQPSAPADGGLDRKENK